MSKPNQLFLLADHIKLSLLERQRAISLNLEPGSQDGHISRSLDSLRDGLEGIKQEIRVLEDAEDLTGANALQQTAASLQVQYDDLASQFHGVPTGTSSITISRPNDTSLSSDFARASERPAALSSSSFLKKTIRDGGGLAGSSPKSVRFSDSPNFQSGTDPSEDANRTALFPYRDDPTAGPPDQSNLDNQQIHAYHSQVMAEQDEQLDRLGESIGRQRDLSIQMGDELDSQINMLDEVDGLVVRHQSRLDQARKSLGTVARKASENKSMTIIIILIIILVLLIIILK